MVFDGQLDRVALASAKQARRLAGPSRPPAQKMRPPINCDLRARPEVACARRFATRARVYRVPA